MRVSDRLVARFENIKKEIDEIMNGVIARTRADDILEQGVQQGFDEAIAFMRYLVDNGKTKEIQKLLKDTEALKERYGRFKSMS